MAVEEGGMHNKELGADGEKMAQKFLKRQGFKIIELNYVSPFGEIDIIARKKDVLAFIEVKSRLSDVFGLPSEAVGFKRKQRYIMGAKYFLTNKNIDLTVRFDIIEIFRGQINYLENAFEF